MKCVRACVRACVRVCVIVITNGIQTAILYVAKVKSAVLHDGEIEQSFRTSAVVRQGCLLSPVLLNLYF